jgi:AAA+ superfamily predicted ATPase
MPLTDPVRDAELLIRSRHPLLQVESDDLPRVRTLFTLLADRMELPLFRWTRARGLRREGAPGPVYQTEEPEKALRHLASSDVPALHHFEGLEAALPGGPLLQAKLVEALDRLEAVGGALLLCGPRADLPARVQGRAVTLPLPSPSREELRELIRHVLRDLNQRTEALAIELSRPELDRLLDHLSGLTLLEAEKVVTRVILEDGRLGPEDLDRVAREKQRIVAEEGLLEYTPVEESMARVADMEGFKTWLRRRTALVHDPERARAFGLDFPRGVLLAGVPGTGKSMAARAVAAEWGLPLLRLDMASLYNKYIGETEKNLGRAMALAERLAPVVLWIDEIEKAFAGGEGGGSGEGSAVSRRVLGSFLSWMQERKGRVFVLATANQVDQLPPELLRKGRFDELFFVDLPDAPSRAEIIRIHLERRKQDPARVDAEAVAAAAEGFSGAELEQVVLSALYAAFADHREMDTDLLLAEVAATRPLSVTARERIEALRRWAEGRTVRAN